MLRDHGATIRRQGLSPAQVDEASKLYVNDGWSLAKIGKHLGFHPSSVHRSLLQNGVGMRPVHQREQR